MSKIFSFITTKKRLIVSIFLTVALVSVFLSTLVGVNYNMVDYLPSDAKSTSAIKIMQNEFKEATPNARVMITDVTVLEAITIKEQIAQIDGIKSIVWLDDVVGKNTLLATPIDFLDPLIVNSYYKNHNALMNISIASGKESPVLKELYSIVGDQGAVAGEAISIASAQDMAVSEVIKAMAILLPIIIFILIISTLSWIEPILFMLTIGIAILINMGTNLIFKEVSFITQTVSPVLQLAVSLDYAIFLLHSFNEYRHEYEPKIAMQMAMKRSLPTVAASAATTVIGFSALLFMRFQIGSDLGINLVKGVLLSFFSVMIFLPALTLSLYKWIDRTKHRNFMPKINRISKGIMKTKYPFLFAIIIIAVPAFLAQRDIEFMYGMGNIDPHSRAAVDMQRIEEQFGKENPLVLIVPKENVGKELMLGEDLKKLEHVTQVVSYATSVGAEIPTDLVPIDILNQFYSDQYARIILYTDNPDESVQSFTTVQNVLDTAKKHYSEYYVTGQSATLYDMRNVVSLDMKVVNIVAVVGILLVLLLTFKSISLPFILVFTIETAIWINLSIAYFSDTRISFVGYLIVSSVQLGATVDYAILITNHYLTDRKGLPKKEAMFKALSENLIAVLISASILSSSGFTLAANSTNPIISELGTLLGRGTVLSFLMVALVLPAILVLFDSFIQKTTFNHGFYTENSNQELEGSVQ